MFAVRILECAVLVLVLATSCPGEDATVSLDLGEDVTMEFVRIPAGSFLMGSPEDEEGRLADEGPQHRVTIAKPFYIGKYEVTNAQFRRFEPRHNSRWYEEYGKRIDLNSDEQPAVMIHWKHTEWFCDWLNEQIKGQFVARLPSEAEWEYVARAGTDTRYSFGDTIDCAKARYGHADGDCGSAKESSPVGSFEPNPWGLFDVHGNAWEWVADCHNPSPEGAPTDARARSDGDCSRRMYRGGAWSSVPDWLRASFRGDDKASVRYYDLGLRVARDG